MFHCEGRTPHLKRMAHWLWVARSYLPVCLAVDDVNYNVVDAPLRPQTRLSDPHDLWWETTAEFDG